EWIKDNRVLQIVLRDSLHQPQYVEKLEKIIRFIIKERALTLDDLDDIWAAQHGKHEAIVKNVHDLLAKLAWDFSPEQLDHLFRCFQTSWSQASKKQREKLLELIRRLAEDDKDGVMAHKVLNLLWSLAHSDDVPTEIMDQALSAHVKILDYSCSQDRDAQKHHWLDRCVEELKHDKWVLPALKQIREICCSYSEAPPTVSQHQRPPSHVNYRPDVISKLQNQHSLVVLVADNLTTYMKNISLLAKDNTNIVASDIFPDGRYNHIAQVQERLSFLRFLLKDGQLWLCAPQAKQIWNCLAENAVFQCDRESCFRWFSKLMGDDPDLDPEINKEFFENNILHLDPSYLTEHGMRCFDRFFKAVNSKEGKLLLKRRTYLMDDLQLIGMNYVWEVVLCSTEDIAQKAIELLRETFTNLGPRLQANQYLIHEDFIMNCISKLKLMYDSVSLLNRDKDGMNKVRQETTRMCRVLKVLYEYIAECDGDFGDDRSILPLARASRGKQLSLIVRFPVQGRQPDELEVWTHVNDTMGSVKRQVMQRLKSSAANVKVELFLNADSLETLDDKKMIAHLSLRDKVILTGKLTQVGSNMASSPDSSSDSSTGSPHPYDGSNIEAENCLPGVIMANQTKYCQFLLQLADLGSSLNLPQLRDGARILLNLIPADQHTEVYYSNALQASMGQKFFNVFQLLCGLLSWACVSKVVLPGVERLLAAEVEWLKGIRQKVLQITRGTPDSPPVEEELIEDFIFPFSKVYLQLEHSSVTPAEQAIPVCSSQPTVIAAYDLLVTLCTGCVQNLNTLANMLTNMFYSVCNEGLETLSVVLALYPPALEALSKESQFHKMVLSLVVHVKERMVRLTAVEQILLIATKCAPSPHTLVVFIVMLFNALNGHQKIYSKEYFQLLCGLLSWACVSKVVLPGVERLLAAEVEWLKGIRQKVLQITRGTPDSPPVEEVLLEGHLCVTRELVAFLSSEKKWELGSENKNINLIRELIEDFIFPFSKVYLQLEHSSVTPAEQAIPVCSSQPTVIAAYDLLVTLCTGCVQNLNTLANMLTNMFYSDCEESLGEWEYLPPVGPRPHKGFVGLKNAGATCYMNSVLQQLYMIKAVREGVLSVEGAATDPDEDFSGEERLEHELQYYVPKGLWKHFKLQGEPVNLREQHDACEFYNILVESINEALKALGENQILNKILGGSFSDQKICKTCPHRYSREEAFTVISIDIRNYSNLYDSLEQYVKGDLLEGDNAYLCEKCDKKVDTVKRICLKKLPPILAIQLKRFDYDWERECSIKFNDYFEFPRELDMEPYTVSGLARNGELIDYDAEDLKNQSCSKYKLTGIVVHSGQASGGHYYSYILHKMGSEQKWYKFDDGEVSECKMDDDEEMKNQCFGGEYVGEQVFDNIMKRVSYRRQKRWWNAYLLFYTRMEDSLLSSMNDLTLTDRPGLIKMPTAIERSVVRQNVRFLHSRSQFSPEYFQFLKNLIVTNHNFVSSPPQDRVSESEEVAMISTKLASKFLFSVGLHTKKTLRGPAQDWYEALQVHLRSSAATRGWFTQHVLFAQPHRFMEYLLECPAPEVRLVFIEGVPSCSLSDQLLIAVLLLLNKEVSEHGRHLLQYFHLFHMYSSYGPQEKLQLLKNCPQQVIFDDGACREWLNVVDTLMLVALDEGPGPAIKYQYPELGKLYQVVSQLIRCCDVSHKCQSSQTNKTPLPNPHGDNTIVEPLMPIQPKVAEILYGRPTYVKKIIEDSNTSEDTLKLLKFCCWENPMFSSMVLSELLWQIAYAYTYELRPYFDLLLHMLLLEDSWQDHRIHNALKGIPDEREGLFETMLRTKNHYQKRAYQCIKCMVALFATCKAANRMLNTNEELKRKWTAAVYWLSDELERRNYSTANQQYYNNWSPQAPSNETSNGYFLERSPSARSTLEKAYELCPEEIEGDECEEGEPALPDEMAPPPPTPTPSCEQTTTVNPTSTSDPETTILSLGKAPDSPADTLSKVKKSIIIIGRENVVVIVVGQKSLGHFHPEDSPFASHTKEKEILDILLSFLHG
ncbi:putative ubiquitin carboxyl-terminal hydrolase FAF-X, partial [Armadillidium nasatum]